jgi:hypothetical protein
MFRNLTQLYALTVCLFCTIALMVTSGIMFNSVIGLFLTESKYASRLDVFLSNDAYIEYKTEHSHDKQKIFSSLSEEEIELKRNEERARFICKMKSEDISSIMGCINWLLVAAFFFIIHWHLHEKYS